MTDLEDQTALEHTSFSAIKFNFTKEYTFQTHYRETNRTRDNLFLSSRYFLYGHYQHLRIYAYKKRRLAIKRKNLKSDWLHAAMTNLLNNLKCLNKAFTVCTVMGNDFLRSGKATRATTGRPVNKKVILP